jgi:hypothetical protein
MRDTTRPTFLVVLAFVTGCGDTPQRESTPVTHVTSGSEARAPAAYGVSFTDVTEQTPTCFYFSGPGELGRDDRLGASAILDETSLTFASGPEFGLNASGVFVRASSHDYDGIWTVHETITLTRSSENRFVGEYHYEEFEPGATTPGQCRIDARIVLGAPEVEPAVSEATRTCMRAVACCAAYFDALGHAAAGMNQDVFCRGVRQSADAGVAGEPACQAVLDGFTQSLIAMDIAIPHPCR